MNIDPIGMKHVGFKITDCTKTRDGEGYALGECGTEFVTWWYKQVGKTIEFYHGHYFVFKPEERTRTRYRALADLHERTAKALDL